jgi:hypothetical protein
MIRLLQGSRSATANGGYSVVTTTTARTKHRIEGTGDHRDVNRLNHL